MHETGLQYPKLFVMGFDLGSALASPKGDLTCEVVLSPFGTVKLTVILKAGVLVGTMLKWLTESFDGRIPK